MPATGAGPGSPSGTGGPGSLGGSGIGSRGGAGSAGGYGGYRVTANLNISPKAIAKGESGKTAAGKGHGEKVTISSPRQNTSQSIVSTSTVAPTQPSPFSSPSFQQAPAPVATGGSYAPPIIGFPTNGYSGPDAANLDLLELAELLQTGADRGYPPIDGDVGADYTDDALTFGGVIAKAKMPLIALAAFLGLGFLAWKVAT